METLRPISRQRRNVQSSYRDLQTDEEDFIDNFISSPNSSGGWEARDGRNIPEGSNARCGMALPCLRSIRLCPTNGLQYRATISWSFCSTQGERKEEERKGYHSQRSSGSRH